MADVEPRIPFEAYVGDEPYIFVSYAHKDAHAVFPELARLRNDGFRVWYDEGIDPGNEWPEEIAKALDRASLFLVFITNNSVNSRNVRNEINFALNSQKPFIAVHLSLTDLPAGLLLRMGDIQAILKHQMTEDGYRRKMEKTLPAQLRTPKQERRIQDASCALRRVIASGESGSIGGVDVSRSADMKRLEATITGEIYPGHVRDLSRRGWSMMGGSGANDPPTGCFQSWPATISDGDLRSVALTIIEASERNGFPWLIALQPRPPGATDDSSVRDG